MHYSLIINSLIAHYRPTQITQFMVIKLFLDTHLYHWRMLDVKEHQVLKPSYIIQANASCSIVFPAYFFYKVECFVRDHRPSLSGSLLWQIIVECVIIAEKLMPRKIPVCTFCTFDVKLNQVVDLPLCFIFLRQIILVLKWTLYLFKSNERPDQTKDAPRNL